MPKPTLIDQAVLRRLGRLSAEEREECLLAIHELQETFGQSHRHSGLGIRKLRAAIFECRSNMRLRILFQNRRECLYIFALLDHDEVKRMLRNGRFG